jgi:hypothetical protein
LKTPFTVEINNNNNNILEYKYVKLQITFLYDGVMSSLMLLKMKDNQQQKKILWQIRPSVK